MEVVVVVMIMIAGRVVVIVIVVAVIFSYKPCSITAKNTTNVGNNRRKY
jgi:uncharacterized membrane protein YqiK